MTKMSVIQPAAAAAAAAQATYAGIYGYAPESLFVLTFPSMEDTDRSFTVLIADHEIADGVKIDCNGIAIIDNDSGRIIVDRIFGQTSSINGPSHRQQVALALLETSAWTDFSEFCRNQPRYRGGVQDIDAKAALPNRGNRERQIAMGLIRESDRDMRSRFIRELDADADVDYSFPRATRAAMMTEILTHDVTQSGADGKTFLAWDIRMNFKYDQTGTSVEKGEDVCPSYDDRWKDHVQGNADVFERACDIALSGYTKEPVEILSDENMVAEMDIAGSAGGFMIMRSFNGIDMSFTSLVDLRDKLNGLPDEGLADLWAAGRTLDVDLNRKNRALEMGIAFNELRRDIEEEWVQEVDEDLSFS